MTSFRALSSCLYPFTDRRNFISEAWIPHLILLRSVHNSQNHTTKWRILYDYTISYDSVFSQQTGYWITYTVYVLINNIISPHIGIRFVQILCPFTAVFDLSCKTHELGFNCPYFHAVFVNSSKIFI